MREYTVTGLRARFCVACRIVGMILLIPGMIIGMFIVGKHAAFIGLAGYALLELWRGANVKD